MKDLKPHRSHLASVLGRYCWVCRVKTQAGIPGWVKPSRNDHFSASKDILSTEQSLNSKYIGPNPYEHLTSVVWANGDRAGGAERPQCKDCGRHCGKPVEYSFSWGHDSYSEIYKSMLK